jgi:hypothetical protein
MCSTTAAQLARICRAIEELAGQPGHRRNADADPRGWEDVLEGTVADPGGAAADHELAARLAAIWAMVAEADPELAKRVPGYLDAAD